MNSLKYSLLAICIFASMQALGQSQTNAPSWQNMMSDQDANFYDIQNAFNAYWADKTPEKGEGWKQFKRWEAFIAPRVYPTGVLPNPMQSNMAMQHWYQTLSGPRRGYWTPLGPWTWTNGQAGYAPGNGRVNIVEVHPTDPNILYVGTPAGGLWKSTDGAQSWNTVTDTFASLGISGIAIHPEDHNTVFIASGDGDGGNTNSLGVLKSTDGGKTWASTGLNWNITQTRKTYRILINPQHPDTMLVAASNGIYRTDDGAQSWTKIQGGNTRDMELHPANPDIVYACYKKYWRSTDGGVTFTQIYNGLAGDTAVQRIALGVTPAAPDMVYALAGNGDGLVGIYLSLDAGDNWTEKATSPNILNSSADGSGTGGQAWYDLAIAVDPNDPGILYTGGINIWQSTDSGQTFNIKSHWVWSNPNPYVHADIHYLGFFGDTLYCGSDGGIFSTKDSASSWTDHTAGIANMQFYRLGGTPQDPDLLYGGTQDNGTYRYDSGDWVHVRGGDGMETAINYRNSDTSYICWQNGGLQRSVNGGNTFQGIRGDITDDGAWTTPYVLHPTDPQTLFAGYQDVWKSTNGGSNWNKISDVTNTKMKLLAVSPADPDFIYAGTSDSIWLTTDGGTNWSNITVGLPDRNMTYLSINPKDPGEASVTFSGFNASEKIFTTYDSGTTWVNETGVLPNLPANTVLYDSSSSNRGMYVGTDVGVYFKNDTLTGWIDFFQNLPNVIVREMEIHYGTGKIRAATYGRGMWESFKYCEEMPDPNFTVSDTAVCAGDTVNFSAIVGATCPQGYAWSFPGGTPATSSEQDPQVVYLTAGIYDVTLQIFNGMGDTSYSKLNRIEVLSDAADAGEDKMICQLDSVQLGVGNDPDYNYTWTPSTGLSATNVGNPWAFPLAKSTYYLTQSHKVAGCPTTDSVTINIFPAPIVNAGEDVTILLGDTTQLSASNGLSHVWTPSLGLDSPNIQKPLAFPNETTEYTVEVTNVNLCSNTDEVIVFVDSPDQVPSLYLNLVDMTIVPNPNTGNFTLHFNIIEAGDISLSSVDMLGRERKLGSKYASKGPLSFSMHDMPKGHYYIKVAHNGRLAGIKKVVILK